MSLLTKERAESSGLSAVSYGPIAKAFNKLPEDERERLRVKFDIAYFVSTESCLTRTIQNENAGTDFVHYIAIAKRQVLLQHLTKAKFFSLLLDGSTDKGMLAVWCDPDEKVHNRMDYLMVSRPQSATANGLFQVLEGGLQSLGIKQVSAEECKKLVGVGTDGAASNIAASGLKRLVEGSLGWVFWMWCLVHQLELAFIDALKGTCFELIDEMLLRLYYLYEKSPKKCRELEDIISDLKECLCFEDAGVKPVRAS